MGAVVRTPGPSQTPHVDIPVLSVMVSGRETPAGVGHEGGTRGGLPVLRKETPECPPLPRHACTAKGQPLA